MVDPSKDGERIDSDIPPGLDADPTTSRPENFRMQQESLLNYYAQNVG